MKGTYTVLLSCKNRVIVRVGRLGRFKVEPGHYLYTGSALGVGAVSLEGRIKRHSRRTKTMRWHIDYLSSNKNCVFAGAVYLISARRLECKINEIILRDLNARPVFDKFGVSDCHCSSHLLKTEDSESSRSVLRRLESVYAQYS